MLKMKICIFMLTAFITFHINNADSHWGYPNLDNGEDFIDWGGLCKSGQRQSPIDLSRKSSLRGKFQDLDFDNYDDKQNGVNIINNGHTIQLNNFARKMSVEQGPLQNKFVVEQIHLHWWSEHTFDNVRYPLEAHIVHRNTQYENMDEAAQHEDGIAVVAILYHVSNEHNKAIEQIVNNLDRVKSYKQLNIPARMQEAFTVKELFPAMTAYITYEGSLTTPSCAEAVRWIVLQETFPVTLEQVEKFKEIEFAEGQQLRNNFRTPQESHNRAVVLVERSGAASMLSLSLGSMLLAMFITKFIQ